MIKHISSGGRYITVSDGSPGHPYISPGAMGAGMMRFNSNTQTIEVNDGNRWVAMHGAYPTVGMTPEAEGLLDWAREKRMEEQRLQEMMDKCPALKKAKDNFDILLNLIKDDYK